MVFLYVYINVLIRSIISAWLTVASQKHNVVRWTIYDNVCDLEERGIPFRRKGSFWLFVYVSYGDIPQAWPHVCGDDWRRIVARVYWSDRERAILRWMLVILRQVFIGIPLGFRIYKMARRNSGVGAFISWEQKRKMPNSSRVAVRRIPGWLSAVGFLY